MLHFAKYINADLENIKLDRQSLFATIQDCFLRRKERHVVDMDWPTPVAVDMDQSVYDSESYDMSHSKESESSDSQNQPSESNSSVPHSHEVSEEEMSSQSEEGSSLGEEHPMGTSSMLDDADLLNESTVAPLSSSSEIPSEMSESGDEEPVQQESNENQVSITEVKEQNNLLRTLLHEVRQGGMPQQSE
ncbi:hypothetical protein WA577_005695, partial [Blastocystis sp. JDR]